MINLLMVFAGGGIGAVARYSVGMAAMRGGLIGWPWATLSVNVIGGLFMGLLAGFLAHRGSGDQEKWRLLLGIGVLGGFTTFSAYSLEIALMIQRREWGQAAGYAAVSSILAIGAVFAGLMIARRAFA